MKHFIAIVSSEYLRDAQIYNAPTQPSFDEAAEDDWVHFSGPGVVWNGHADTTQDVIDNLRNLYKCPESAFSVLEIAD